MGSSESKGPTFRPKKRENGSNKNPSISLNKALFPEAGMGVVSLDSDGLRCVAVDTKRLRDEYQLCTA